MNPKVDFFFTKPSQWQSEYSELRKVLLDTPLDEELKWGCPCYSLQKKNVVLIHGFKEYCALLFMKGALMQDDHGLLIQQTENVQAARQIRFTSLAQILELKEVVKSYVHDAIEIEKAGRTVTFATHKELEFPDEFQSKLDTDPNLKAAFEALTPGRQRAYQLHFSSAKQAKTREARVEKCIPLILDGKGLED